MTATTTTRATIREFLALPSEALPQAYWMDDQYEMNPDAWYCLRDYVHGGKHCWAVFGERVRLTADRDGWRDGVVLTLTHD